MTEKRKVNIMSVQLAIKRELAYREKLARLYPEEDWTKEFLPLEVPFSTTISSQNPNSTHLSEPDSISIANNPSLFPNPSCQNWSSTIIVQGDGQFPVPDVASYPAPSFTGGLKPSPVQRQDPSPCSRTKLDTVMVSIHSVTEGNTNTGSFHPLLNQQLQTGPGPYPASYVTLVASHQVPSAIVGLEPSRVENRELNPSPWPNLDMASSQSVNKEKATATSFHSLPYQQPLHIGNTNLFCNVCKVSCSSPYNYKQHMEGHKHKAKLQLLQLRGNNGWVNKPQQPMCNLCQIGCTDENSLELHFKGQKHKAKLKEIELGQKWTAPQQLWCELCQVPCPNKDSFRMHLKGKNHAAHLRAMGKSNRAM